MNVRRITAPLSVLVSCLALALPAQAELNAYMRIKGAKQGDIKGSVTQKGREDTIMVIAMDHTMTSPTDPASGLPTGKRMHKPFTITKEIDKSTPLLRAAFATNEILSEVVLQFWTPQIRAATGTGAEVQHFTVTLKNARISNVHHVMLNNKDPELTRYAASEEISFTYESITWTWNEGGISATDSAAR